MTTDQRHDIVCASCGHLNPSASSFCRVCGSSLRASSSSVEPTERPEIEPPLMATPSHHRPYPVDSRSQSGGPPVILAVLVAIGLACAGVAAVLLVHGSSKGPSRAPLGHVVTTTVTQTESAASPEGSARDERPPVEGPREAAPPAATDTGGLPDGFTVALASDTTHADAVAARARARVAGMPSVGIVLSSRYRSLTPGYWFVFSGVYRSAAAARAHVSQAVKAGFGDAYVRRVTK